MSMKKGDVIVSTEEEILKQREEWINSLPEAFGIRDMIVKSKYRKCVVESAVWGFGTSFAMYFHRRRMGSSILISTHTSFFVCQLVLLSSYYICYKQRDSEEEVIGEMMKFNQFLPMKEMPEKVPLDDNHPFFRPVEVNDNDDNAIDETTTTATTIDMYEAKVPKRKEWQPKLPSLDPFKFFGVSKKPDNKEDE